MNVRPLLAIVRFAHRSHEVQRVIRPAVGDWDKMTDLDLLGGTAIEARLRFEKRDEFFVWLAGGTARMAVNCRPKHVAFRVGLAPRCVVLPLLRLNGFVLSRNLHRGFALRTPACILLGAIFSECFWT